MMTKRFSALILLLLLSGLGLPLFCESGKWVIAAQKFKADKGLEDNSVNDKTAVLLPADILEKVGNSIVRNVIPQEEFERTKYKLRSERQALFLQLSAEYKKRDSLVLSNYSDFKLKSAIYDSDKKIKDIQKKIEENLESLKKAAEENEEKMAELEASLSESEEGDSEINKFKTLFKNIFVKDQNLIQQEEISFYKNDFTALYTPPSELQELDYTDPLYEKNMVSANINSLLTGHFSIYGDYISVYVDLYTYPGVKKIGSVAEIGSTQDLGLVTNSIAMQLMPLLANSFPVQLELQLGPEEAAENAVIYIDDSLEKAEDGKIIIDSGIHTIQFISEGYKSAATSYSFEGNKKYRIEVNFEKPKSGFLQLGLRKPIEGDILMNGERALEVDGKKSQIAINGKEILGEFITEEGQTAFFYIPKKLTFDGSYVTIKPKPMDRMSYIDTRRKIMYASYSAFIVSLIPTFYTYGNYLNYVNLYKNNQIDYETANGWQKATNITRVISIGLGLFWGYELVRYLIAANTVLPQNARAGDPEEFDFQEPELLEKRALEKKKAEEEAAKKEESASEAQSQADENNQSEKTEASVEASEKK